MNKEYYDMVTKLEDIGANDDYICGWQEGYLGMPEREEQRVNEAYEAGYEDGGKHTFDKAGEYIK